MSADSNFQRHSGVWRQATRMAAWAAVVVISSVRPVQGAQLFGAWVEDPLLVQPPILATGPALAGEPSPLSCMSAPSDMPLDLVRAVDIALCRNPQAKQAWAGIKQQAASLGEARAAYLPTVGLGASRTSDKTWFPNSGQPGTSLQGSSVYVNLSWRLLDGGARDANAEQSTLLLNAAIANHDAALQHIVVEVIQAYFDAQSARAAWSARENNESLATQTLDSAMRRESRGAGALADTLQARTALAKASLEKSRAQGAYRKAQALLGYALGSASNRDYELADDLSDATPSLHQALDEWLQQAQEQHPALIAARAELAAARAKVSAVQAEGRPTLDLTSNFYQNGRPTQGLSPVKTRERLIGVTLTVPLFEGFARTYKVQGAQALVERKEAELSGAQQQVAMDLLKTHADAVAALANLEASQRLLDAAQASIATSQRKFDRGAADILEMLNVQAALGDAQQERIRCLADWRSARLRLFAVSGSAGHVHLTPQP